MEELVSASDFDPNEIKAYEEAGVTTVRYGDGLIVTLNDAEAKGSGLSRQALAAQYIKLLQEKLTLAREQHTPRYLWRAATYAAVTLLIYLLVLWLIIAGTRWILRTVETSAKMRFKGIKIQQSEIVQGAPADRAACIRREAVARRVGRNHHLHCAGQGIQLLSLDTRARPTAAGICSESPHCDGRGYPGVPAEFVLHLRDRGGDCTSCCASSV